MFFLLLLILPGVRTQDPTPQSYLRQHRLPFKTVQFLQHKEHLRKGPILFPNDAAPPPPTPLIVTSRPLSESIARSELNPNNSIAAQSQYHQVTFRPNYLARGNNYEPYSYTLTTVAPAYDDFDPVKINEERMNRVFKDYERLLEYMHPRKPHRNKRSADTDVVPPSERSKSNQRRLMEFITPRKPDSKAGEAMVQTLQERMFDQNKKLPMFDEEKGNQNNTGSQHAPSYNRNAQSTTKDDYYEFNEEDNNFDFDFKKFNTMRRKSIESNSSEYLEYYPDSIKTRRRQFPRFSSDDRPSNYRNKNSKGKAWLRLSEDEENRPPDSAEETDEIADILGLSTTRHSVMKSVKHDGNVKKSNEMNSRNYEMDRLRRQRKTSANSGRRGKPQLRVVKPLYEFDNAQRQQNIPSKAHPHKYKNSPDHYYHSKNKGGEHDYSQETNPSDNYAFSYTVKDHKTGDDFSHSQKSTGSATNGEYRVLLPDGRTQIVSYTADENGYRADVRYDEQNNKENSLDYEHDKDKSLGNNDRHKVKHNYGHNRHHTGHDEILYRPQQSLYKVNVPNYEQIHVENVNDYRQRKNNNFQHFHVHPTKAAFVGTTANINDRNLDGLSDNNNDYLEQYNARLENKDNVERTKDDYEFSGEPNFSKEVVDYSSELDHAHVPYESKFSSLFNNQNAQEQGQVRPSYNELKHLFVTNANGRRNAAIPVSTVRPVYAVTPADVVPITPKKPVHNLYTNIKNIVTPAPFIFSTPSPSTPRSYLLSTIANLKHQISLTNKPVLSEQYINKINKYLSYSNPVKVTNK